MNEINRNMRITVDQLSPIVCENCKEEVFDQGVMLREVSALLTGTGKSEMTPIPVFVCRNCNEVLQRALPEELRKKKIVGA